jgi:hypothetical protein
MTGVAGSSRQANVRTMPNSLKKMEKFCVSILILSALSVANAESELEKKFSTQWHGSDAQRIEFVRWVNETQPFRGLSQSQVAVLMGEPTSTYDNQEYPYNGLAERFNEEDFSRPQNKSHRPVVWEYQTLRKGSEESQYWGREGSSYLLDLVIQFDIDGDAYGCGTVQFTTGGDYYEMLERSSE